MFETKTKPKTENLSQSFECRAAILEKQREQVTLQQLFENLGVIVAHSLPDDSKEAAERFAHQDYTTFQLLEAALDRCLSQPIENLCFTSSLEGDDHNRWAGRFFGVLALSGVIVNASANDANSWHKKLSHYSVIAPNKDIIQSIQRGNRRSINEINIRTVPKAMLPYFDLDYLMDSLKWGTNVKNDSNPISIAEQPSRFKKLMDERKFPYVGIYKGKPVKFDPVAIEAKLKMFAQPIDNDADVRIYKANRALLELYLKKTLTPISFGEMMQCLPQNNLSSQNKNSNY